MSNCKPQLDKETNNVTPCQTAAFLKSALASNKHLNHVIETAMENEVKLRELLLCARMALNAAGHGAVEEEIWQAQRDIKLISEYL